MPERTSPLAHCQQVAGLSHRACTLLMQYHAWPAQYLRVAEGLAAHCRLPEAPRPGKAACGAGASLLRIHPQRLWLVAEDSAAVHCPQISTGSGATLDLTHARAMIHVQERIAGPLLSRFVAVDLRPHCFARDDIALTALHRVGVVVWRRADGIDVLVPRSFAHSLWDLLAEAAQRLA
jgi:heterotetrameric sarcosine oxidase gamma subunit